MPLDFPASPTNGQLYPAAPNAQYIYNATAGGPSTGAWESLPMQSAKTVTDDVAPLNPADGDQWFSTVDGVLYIYVVDVDGGQWVESRSAIISDGYYSPNYIINGGFDIWQRGTSSTLGINTPGFLADRFRCAPGGSGNASLSRQAFSAGAGPASGIEAPYFLRYQQTVGGTRSGSSYEGPMIHQFIENFNDVQGKPVTFSFYAKAASNITVTAGYNLESGSINGSAFGTFNITTSWQRFTGTATIPTGGSALRILIYLPESSTFTFDVWGVQLEAGSVATPFRRNANSIQGELAACQRYYQRYVATGSGGYTIFLNSGITTSSTAGIFIHTPIIPLRAIPSSVDYSTLRVLTGYNSAQTATLSSVSINGQTSPTNLVIDFVGVAMAVNVIAWPQANNSTSAYIGFSAEL